MIKIRFRKPGTNGFVHDIEMPAVPRIGETISFGKGDDRNQICRIHDIEWTPDEPRFNVYVVLR